MNMMPRSDLPVTIIGAGPVGFAAAARIVEHGLRSAVFEKDRRVGTAILKWGDVRDLLGAEGIAAPSGSYRLTGKEIVDEYPEPLAPATASACCRSAA